MSRSPRKLSLVVSGALALVLMISTLGSATSLTTWTGAEKHWNDKTRSGVPEDRYAMAGGCYALKSPDRGYAVRSDDGFSTSGTSLAEAEPFHFQATDLGSYLLYGSNTDFLAASEGTLEQAVYGVTRSQPGAVAGGVAMEKTDEAADTLARSEANRASGRGESVVAASEASELADWKVVESNGGFAFHLPATDQTLVDDAGRLDLADGEAGSAFELELTDGCAHFPEIELNVDGPIMGGQTPYQEVRGYLDAHLHGMAYEFLGGRARCGRPWHRYGVDHALTDCPDHEPGGYGAVLEGVLSNGSPDGRHNTDGWPSFQGWPKFGSLTHEQVYYRWLERAWRGGLRMFTNLLVDNNQLCKAYPYKRNSCNEMDGVRLQAKRIHQLQDYIDAQSGGPGEGWFRIVTDPFEAREVINDGRLAVVLGIEVSVPLDCGETQGLPRCDLSDIGPGLDEVYDLGVRQMELVNKFDNAFSGVAGDGGTTGVVVNQGNLGETGHYWKMETCGEQDHGHDKTQMNVTNDAPFPDEFTGRDSLAGAIFAASGKSGVAPIYPEGPHCNVMGLSELGKEMIRGLVRRGMIFDPDHMSARAQTEALDLFDPADPSEVADADREFIDYSGVISSHGWSNDSIYPRVYELGGVVTPYAGGSQGFVEDWRTQRQLADPRFYFGFGYGSDVNGFGSQGGPRPGGNVSYPFEAFGGVTVDKQYSGPEGEGYTYDINTDGVAHYGLYPDWIEDLRLQAGDAIIDDMLRGPEAYLQMWERATGIPGDACRPDVGDLIDADIRAIQPGMSPEGVLWKLGQPSTRVGNTFTYCVGGQRTATVTFTDDGYVYSAKACPNSNRPVVSADGRPSSRGHEVPGNSCGQR